MKFGKFPTAECEGAVLAHSVQIEGGRLRKGMILGIDELNTLQNGGITEITAAQLEPGDIAEDDAAKTLACALVPNPSSAGLRLGAAATGRCNVFAEGAGVIQIDAKAIDRANAVHPMITIATVPDLTRMEAGGMVATVKIIAYSVPDAALKEACECARAGLSMASPKRLSVALIETGIGDVVLSDKGARAIAGRVEALGGALDVAAPCAHDISDLAARVVQTKADLILILTASATSDIHDTAPQALVEAGGAVTHFGMPVDPGNLLFIGDLAGTPVIGLPGCVRSPALNGADWVLERVMCGLDVTASDIMGMGVGGLLKEIPTRPQPRKTVSP